MLKTYFYFLLFFLLLSCSNNNENDGKIEYTKVSETPEELYLIAMNSFQNKEYDDALENFNILQKIYPLSNEGIQAEIMSGFIEYLNMNYESAILKFNRIIRKYPSLKNLDYVYYMRAMCYYEQIYHEGLDGKNNQLALENFLQVIKRFPKSEYAKDSQQKIILIKSNIAAKHMNIARFYLKKKKYSAALNRFKIVVENYSETKFTPEALFRMVEIYYTIGMMEDAKKTTATIGYNYPESKWYKYSYDLVSNNNREKNFFKNLF